MHITKTVLFIGAFYFLSFNTYAKNDYLQALEAETKSEFSTPATTSDASATKLTDEMYKEFEQRLKNELRASFHTYKRLKKKYQSNVVQYFFEHEKSMDNITIKLLEQYSLQVKNE